MTILSTASSAPKRTERLELVRALGPWAALAIVVGTMVGTGIFLKPGEMASVGGSVSVVYAAWIIGGLLSMFGALSFAELGAALPEAGGQYAYLRKGLGPVWGFLFGWMHSTVGESSSAASIAAGFARFLSFLVPVVAAPIFSLHLTSPMSGKPYEFAFTWAQPLAAGLIALFTFINYLGVRVGGRVQITLTILKVGAVLTIVAAGFWFGHGSSEHFHPFWPAHSTMGMTGFFAALAAALWAYDGWEDLNRVGSEIQNPQRNIPVALVGGTILVAGLYLLFSAVCFYALPFSSVAFSAHVASDVIASFAGHGAAGWITLAMLVSALGTLNSSILSGARVPYAMARDGLFFRVTGIVHRKFRTPGGALLFQGVLAGLMALTGTFEELTSLFVFAAWIFYALSVVAMFRLRRIAPDLPRPYRTWGYPVVPALFVAGAVALTVNIWIERPVRSSIGLALILSGLFFYRLWNKNVSEASKYIS
ncbi:MAG: amino acid permease [Candidatus Acidiferrales bacterium]